MSPPIRKPPLIGAWQGMLSGTLNPARTSREEMLRLMHPRIGQPPLAPDLSVQSIATDAAALAARFLPPKAAGSLPAPSKVAFDGNGARWNWVPPAAFGDAAARFEIARLEVSTGVGGSIGSVDYRKGTQDYERPDGGLQPGTSYVYVVEVVDDVGNRSDSASSERFTTDIDSPSNLRAVWKDRDTIELSWDPVSGATGYLVERVGRRDRVTSGTSLVDREVNADKLDKYYVTTLGRNRNSNRVSLPPPPYSSKTSETALREDASKEVGLESAIDALIKCIREHKDDSSKDLLARFEKILKFDSSIAESKIFLALDPVGQTHFAEVIKQLAAEIAKNRFRKLNETHINEIIRTLNDIAERRRSPEGHYDLQH